MLLLVILMVLVKFDFPIFFKQAKSGLNKKIFYMFIFRTMGNESDKNENLLCDKLRLTAFGKFLRSTSLDELLGMWSIIKGDILICYADYTYALEKIGWCAEYDLDEIYEDTWLWQGMNLNEYSEITTKE